MKLSAFLLSLALSFSSVSFAEVGGISAGGGGTTNPDPVGVLAIKRAAHDAKFVLRSYLSFLEYGYKMAKIYQRPVDAEAEFLFGSEYNVFEAMDHQVITLRSRQACVHAGREVDGSYDPKGGICLSAERLGQKLSQFNYEYEVIALVLHEIVHAMGGSEAMAEAIQKRAALDLHKTGSQSIRDSFSSLPFSLDFSDEIVASIIDANDAGDFNGICESFDGLNGLLRSAHEDSYALLKFAPTRFSVAKDYEAAMHRLEMARGYACAKDPVWPQEIRDQYNQLVDQIYGADTALSLRELFLRSELKQDMPDFDGYILKKITTDQIWKQEIREAMKTVRAYTRGIKDGLLESFPVRD